MEPLAFKFKIVVEGEAQGLLASKGSVDAESVRAGEIVVPYDRILDVTVRDKRVVIVFEADEDLGTDNATIVVLQIYKIAPTTLKRHIDRARSGIQAEAHRSKLQEEGKGGLFRVVNCPVCDAFVDLSELDGTRYVNCHCCDTVFTDQGNVVTSGEEYNLCDECGFFGRTRGYTAFYFYFLLVVWGYSHNRRFLCDHCARGLGGKLLVLNLLFLLGVPNALRVLLRAYTGGDPALPGLAAAIALGKKGDYRRVGERLEEMYANYPDHPGLLYDQALSHFNGDDPEGGFDGLKRALDACANYAPALRMFAGLQAAVEQEEGGSDDAPSQDAQA